MSRFTFFVLLVSTFVTVSCDSSDDNDNYLDDPGEDTVSYTCSSNDDCAPGQVCGFVGGYGICTGRANNSLPEFTSFSTDWGTFTETACGGAFDMCISPSQELPVGSCVTIRVHAEDPDLNKIYYKFWIPSHDFDGGIRYLGDHDLVGELSGSKDTFELCAFSYVSGEHSVWIQISDMSTGFPYNQGLVRFYISQ